MALRLLGKEVEFYRFPAEGHELSRSGSPVHRVQRAGDHPRLFFGKRHRPTDLTASLRRRARRRSACGRSRCGGGMVGRASRPEPPRVDDLGRVDHDARRQPTRRGSRSSASAGTATAGCPGSARSPTSTPTSSRPPAAPPPPASRRLHEAGEARVHRQRGTARRGPAAPRRPRGDERDHRRRQPREGQQPARRAAHRPLAGRRLGRRAAAPAEAMGARPLHELHGPAGDGPLDLAAPGRTVRRRSSRRASVGASASCGTSTRPARHRAEHAEEVLAASRRPRRLVADARPSCPTHVEPAGARRWPGCRAAGASGRQVGTALGDRHRCRRLPGMTNVVIVDAVRTPIGRRGGGLSTVHPADLLGHRPDRRSSSAPASTRPRSARSSAAASARSASRLQHHPHRLAGRRPAAQSVAGHHRRHPVRLEPAGHQPGHLARRLAAWSTSRSPAASR